MKIKIISDVKWETPQVDFSVTMFPWRKEELAPERKKKIGPSSINKISVLLIVSSERVRMTSPS